MPIWVWYIYGYAEGDVAFRLQNLNCTESITMCETVFVKCYTKEVAQWAISEETKNLKI